MSSQYSAAPTFRAFLREPFDLAIGQPHQLLISSASVAIVAAEAHAFIPLPFNVLLAVGAEWAYLRGLISGSGVRTRWAAALNTSAFLLVVLYGSLWGFRGFHLIPDAPPAWAAVLLTIIHIGAIGAVTVCSAMLHRAGMDALSAEKREVADRETERQERIQAERDLIALEMDRKQRELELWERAEETRARLKLQAAEQRARVRSERPQRAPGTAANTPPNTDREQLREQIVRTLREQPKANRSQLARQLGIGRTTLYELIEEARRVGELPDAT